MQITAVFTLSFSMRCTSSEQHKLALGIVKFGAQSLKVEAEVKNLPLSSTEDNGNSNTMVKIQADESDVCEAYWIEVSRALALIGVEATSP